MNNHSSNKPTTTPGTTAGSSVPGKPTRCTCAQGRAESGHCVHQQQAESPHQPEGREHTHLIPQGERAQLVNHDSAWGSTSQLSGSWGPLGIWDTVHRRCSFGRRETHEGGSPTAAMWRSIPVNLHQWMSGKQALNDPTLNPFSPSMNHAHLRKPQGMGLHQILLDHRSHIPGGERMQVDAVFNGH